MRAIIYCYGDGYPTILGSENLNDADRRALLSHSLLQLKGDDPERCEGRYPVTHERTEGFDVTYRCAFKKGHSGPHGPGA